MVIAQRARRWTVPLALALSIVLLAALPAAAAPPYAAWTTTTASPPAVGFPGADLVTTSTNFGVESGASVFLPASSPFGAVYGSSQNQQYLSVGTATQPRATTLTFTSATPASGWGFALGDLDSEFLTVSALDATGIPVPAGALGFRSAFNYAGGTDQATQTATTTEVVLTGNGPDTSGSAAWFQPTVALSSLTVVIDDLQGSPRFQLWIASLTAQVSGTVTTPDPQGTPIPVEGATVTVADDAGVPVLTDPTDPASAPVSTSTDPAGAFTVPDLFPGDGADFPGTYNLVITPPADQPQLTPQTVPVDVSAGDVADLSVVLVEEVVPPPPPVLPPPAAPPAPAPPVGSASQLSATGASVGTPLGLGALLVLTGVAVCWTARRHLRQEV